MDLDYIRRRAEAARLFQRTVGGCSFELRRPTKLQTSVAFAEARAASTGAPAAAHVRFQRLVLLQALVGWSGVLVRHVLPGHEGGDEPFAFEPGAVEVLLDAQPEWESGLLSELLAEADRHRQAEEAAAGN
jgi:hypothetical protein